jgi:DNA polymerase III delta subunit
MLHFYQGSDAYRLRSAVHAAIERAPRGTPVTTVDLLQKNQSEELERLLKYPSFFQEATIIIVRNILANAEVAEEALKVLERYAAQTLPDVTVITVNHSSGGRESAATKKLSAYLTKHAAQMESLEPLAGAQKAEWVRSFCAQRQCTVPPATMTALAMRVADDTWALANELEKLCAYTGSGEIRADTVTTLIPTRVERDEFELTNALYSHNKRAALGTLWQRLTEGTAEQLLLGTLASAFRTMIMVKSGNAVGIHPFVAGKARRGASAYTDQQLTSAHISLATLDRSSKDGRTDLADGLFGVLLGL